MATTYSAQHNTGAALFDDLLPIMSQLSGSDDLSTRAEAEALAADSGA